MVSPLQKRELTIFKLSSLIDSLLWAAIYLLWKAEMRGDDGNGLSWNICCRKILAPRVEDKTKQSKWGQWHLNSRFVRITEQGKAT